MEITGTSSSPTSLINKTEPISRATHSHANTSILSQSIQMTSTRSTVYMVIEATFAEYIQSTRSYLFKSLTNNWKQHPLTQVEQYLDSEFAPVSVMRTLIVFSRSNLDIVVWFLLQWRVHALAQYKTLINTEIDGLSPQSVLGHTSGGLVRSKVVYACAVDCVVARSLLYILAAVIDGVGDSMASTTPDQAIKNILAHGGSTTDFIIAAIGHAPAAARPASASLGSGFTQTAQTLREERVMGAEASEFDLRIRLRLRQREATRVEALCRHALAASTAKADAMPQVGLLFNSDATYKLGLLLHRRLCTLWGHVAGLLSAAVCLINTDAASAASPHVMAVAAERTHRHLAEARAHQSAFVAPADLHSVPAARATTYTAAIGAAAAQQVGTNTYAIGAAVDDTNFSHIRHAPGSGAAITAFGGLAASHAQASGALALAHARAEQYKLAVRQEQDYSAALADTEALFQSLREEESVSAFAGGQVKLVFGYALVEALRAAGQRGDSDLLRRLCRAVGAVTLDLSCANNVSYAAALLQALAQVMEGRASKDKGIMGPLCFALSNALWGVYDRRWRVDLDYAKLGLVLNQLLTCIERHAQDSGDWEAGLPAYTACVCALPKHNFLMKFEGAQAFILRCMQLRDKDTLEARRVRVMALRCAQRILYVYYSRVFERGAETQCDISKFIATDVVAAASQHTALAAKNGGDRGEDVDGWGMVLRCPLLPLHSQWLSADNELENAFLSVVLTIACHDPVLALRNAVIPLFKPLFDPAAQLDDTQVLTAEAQRFSAQERSKARHRADLHTIEQVLTRGGVAVGVTLGLRALAIIMAGRLALSPVTYGPGLVLDNTQSATIVSHVLAQHQQAYQQLLHRAKLAAAVGSGAVAPGTLHGGLGQFDYMCKGGSVLQRIDELATLTWGKADAFAEQMSFSWAPTSSVLASLLPMLPHVDMEQLLSRLQGEEAPQLARALASLVTMCVQRVGGLRFPHYRGQATDRELSSLRPTTATLALLLQCLVYVWPANYDMAHVVSLVVRLLVHLDRSVREAASRLASAMLTATEDAVKRAAVLNAIAHHTVGAQVAPVPLPQSLAASVLALEYALGGGDGGLTSLAAGESPRSQPGAAGYTEYVYARAAENKVARVLPTQDNPQALVVVARMSTVDPLLLPPGVSTISTTHAQPGGVPNNYINLEPNNNDLTLAEYRAYRASVAVALQGQTQGWPRGDTWQLQSVAAVTAVSRLEARDALAAAPGVDILQGHAASEQGCEEALAYTWQLSRGVQLLQCDVADVLGECAEVCTDGYYARLLEAIRRRHEVAVERLNLATQRDAKQSLYSYNNGHGVNMNNNYGAYGDRVTAARDVLGHSVHVSHNGFDIARSLVTAAGGDPLQGHLLNTHTNMGLSQHLQPLSVPSPRELRLEALLVWVHHIAARVARVETLLTALSHVDWSLVEAAGTASLSHASVGVRQTALDALTHLHMLSNGHLELIHQLTVLEDKRAAIVSAVNREFYDSADGVAAARARAREGERRVAERERAARAAEERAEGERERARTLEEHIAGHTEEDSEEEEECDEDEEEEVETYTQPDGTVVSLVTKTSVKVVKTVRKVRVMRRASGVCLLEPDADAEVMAPTLVEPASLSMTEEEEDQEDEEEADEDDENEEHVYVHALTSNVDGVEVRHGSRTHAAKLSHAYAGADVRTQVVRLGLQQMQGGQMNGAVLNTAAYTAPLRANTAYPSGHTPTQSAGGLASVACGFLPPRRHLLALACEMHRDIKQLLMDRGDSSALPQAMLPASGHESNALLDEMRVLVMDREEHAADEEEEDGEDVLSNVSILHSRHSLETRALALLRSLASNWTARGQSTWAAVLGLIMRRYLHSALVQQALVQVQSATRGVICDRTTRRKGPSVREQAGATADRTANGGGLIANVADVLIYRPDEDVPQPQTHAHDASVLVPETGAAADAILLGAGAEGENAPQYRVRCVRVVHDGMCTSYFVSTAAKLYTFTAPLPLESLHALASRLHRNVTDLHTATHYAPLMCDNDVVHVYDPYREPPSRLCAAELARITERDRVDHDKDMMASCLHFWLRLQSVLAAVVCIADTRLPIPQQHLRTAAHNLAALADKQRHRVSSTTTGVSAASGAPLTPPGELTVTALVSQVLGPWLFADQYGVFKDLLTRLMCVCARHRRTAAIALANASPLAHHSLLHAMAALELAVYGFKPKQALCSLPAVARNIHGRYCCKEVCHHNCPGIGKLDCASPAHGGGSVSTFISPEELYFDDDVCRATGLSSSGTNAAQFGHYMAHCLRVNSADEVIYAPHRTYVVPSDPSLLQRILPVPPVYRVDWPAVADGLRSALGARKGRLGQGLVCLRAAFGQFYAEWATLTSADVMATMWHGKSRCLLAMHEAVAWLSARGNEKDVDAHTLSLRGSLAVLVRRLCLVEMPYTIGLNAYYSNVNQSYHHAHLGVPTYAYKAAADAKAARAGGVGPNDAYTSQLELSGPRPGLFRHPTLSNEHANLDVCCYLTQQPLVLCFSNFLRRHLFSLLSLWCGHGNRAARDHERQARAIATLSGPTTATAAHVQAAWANVQQECATAMATLLAGPYFDPQLLSSLQNIECGPASPTEHHSVLGVAQVTDNGGDGVYQWIRSVLLCDDRAHQAAGFLALHLLLTANAPLLFAFIHHCYHAQEEVASRFFLVVVRVVLLGYSRALVASAPLPVTDASLALNPVLGYAFASGIEGYTDDTGAFVQPASVSPDSALATRTHALHDGPVSLLPLHLVLHLVLFKLADRSYAVRAVALRALPILEVHARALTKAHTHRQALLLGYACPTDEREANVTVDMIDGFLDTNGPRGVDCSAERAELLRLVRGWSAEDDATAVPETWSIAEAEAAAQQDTELPAETFFNSNAYDFVTAPAAAAALTSHLPESYLNVQKCWSRRLATQFPGIALPFLHELCCRALLTPTGEHLRVILGYAVPWMERLTLTSATQALPFPLLPRYKWTQAKARRAEAISPYYSLSGPGPHTYGMGNGSGAVCGLHHTAVVGALQTQSLLWALFNVSVHAHPHAPTHVDALWTALLTWQLSHAHFRPQYAPAIASCPSLSAFRRTAQLQNVAVVLDFATYCIPARHLCRLPRPDLHVAKAIAVFCLRAAPLFTMYKLSALVGPRQLHDMGDAFARDNTPRWLQGAQSPRVAGVCPQRVDTYAMFTLGATHTLDDEQVRAMPAPPTSLALFAHQSGNSGNHGFFNRAFPPAALAPERDLGAAALAVDGALVRRAVAGTNIGIVDGLSSVPLVEGAEDVDADAANPHPLHGLDRYTCLTAQASGQFAPGANMEVDASALALMCLVDCAYEMTLTSTQSHSTGPQDLVEALCRAQTQLELDELATAQENACAPAVVSPALFPCSSLVELLVCLFHACVVGLTPHNTEFTRTHAASLLVNLAHAVALIPVNNHVRDIVQAPELGVAEPGAGPTHIHNLTTQTMAGAAAVSGRCNGSRECSSQFGDASAYAASTRVSQAETLVLCELVTRARALSHEEYSSLLHNPLYVEHTAGQVTTNSTNADVPDPLARASGTVRTPSTTYALVSHCLSVLARLFPRVPTRALWAYWSVQWARATARVAVRLSSLDVYRCLNRPTQDWTVHSMLMEMLAMHACPGNLAHVISGHTSATTPQPTVRDTDGTEAECERPALQVCVAPLRDSLSARTLDTDSLLHHHCGHALLEHVLLRDRAQLTRATMALPVFHATGPTRVRSKLGHHVPPEASRLSVCALDSTEACVEALWSAAGSVTEVNSQLYVAEAELCAAATLTEADAEATKERSRAASVSVSVSVSGVRTTHAADTANGQRTVPASSVATQMRCLAVHWSVLEHLLGALQHNVAAASQAILENAAPLLRHAEDSCLSLDTPSAWARLLAGTAASASPAATGTETVDSAPLTGPTSRAALQLLAHATCLRQVLWTALAVLRMDLQPPAPEAHAQPHTQPVFLRSFLPALRLLLAVLHNPLLALQASARPHGRDTAENKAISALAYYVQWFVTVPPPFIASAAVQTATAEPISGPIFATYAEAVAQQLAAHLSLQCTAPHRAVPVLPLPRVVGRSHLWHGLHRLVLRGMCTAAAEARTLSLFTLLTLWNAPAAILSLAEPAMCTPTAKPSLLSAPLQLRGCSCRVFCGDHCCGARQAALATLPHAAAHSVLTLLMPTLLSLLSRQDSLTVLLSEDVLCAAAGAHDHLRVDGSRGTDAAYAHYLPSAHTALAHSWLPFFTYTLAAITEQSARRTNPASVAGTHPLSQAAVLYNVFGLPLPPVVHARSTGVSDAALRIVASAPTLTHALVLTVALALAARGAALADRLGCADLAQVLSDVVTGRRFVRTYSRTSTWCHDQHTLHVRDQHAHVTGASKAHVWGDGQHRFDPTINPLFESRAHRHAPILSKTVSIAPVRAIEMPFVCVPVRSADPLSSALDGLNVHLTPLPHTSFVALSAQHGNAQPADFARTAVAVWATMLHRRAVEEAALLGGTVRAQAEQQAHYWLYHLSLLEATAKPGHHTHADLQSLWAAQGVASERVRAIMQSIALSRGHSVTPTNPAHVGTTRTQQAYGQGVSAAGAYAAQLQAVRASREQPLEDSLTQWYTRVLAPDVASTAAHREQDHWHTILLLVARVPPSLADIQVDLWGHALVRARAALEGAAWLSADRVLGMCMHAQRAGGRESILGELLDKSAAEAWAAMDNMYHARHAAMTGKKQQQPKWATDLADLVNLSRSSTRGEVANAWDGRYQRVEVSVYGALDQVAAAAARATAAPQEDGLTWTQRTERVGIAAEEVEGGEEDEDAFTSEEAEEDTEDDYVSDDEEEQPLVGAMPSPVQAYSRSHKPPVISTPVLAPLRPIPADEPSPAPSPAASPIAQTSCQKRRRQFQQLLRSMRKQIDEEGAAARHAAHPDLDTPVLLPNWQSSPTTSAATAPAEDIAMPLPSVAAMSRRGSTASTASSASATVRANSTALSPAKPRTTRSLLSTPGGKTRTSILTSPQRTPQRIPQRVSTIAGAARASIYGSTRASIAHARTPTLTASAPPARDKSSTTPASASSQSTAAEHEATAPGMEEMGLEQRRQTIHTAPTQPSTTAHQRPKSSVAKRMEAVRMKYDLVQRANKKVLEETLDE